MPTALAVLVRLYDRHTLSGQLSEHVRQADVDAMRFLVDGQIGLRQLRAHDVA